LWGFDVRGLFWNITRAERGIGLAARIGGEDIKQGTAEVIGRCHGGDEEDEVKAEDKEELDRPCPCSLDES